MKVSHEIFAINVVAGFNQTEAYLEAMGSIQTVMPHRGKGQTNALIHFEQTMAM